MVEITPVRDEGATLFTRVTESVIWVNWWKQHLLEYTRMQVIKISERGESMLQRKKSLRIAGAVAFVVLGCFGATEASIAQSESADTVPEAQADQSVTPQQEAKPAAIESSPATTENSPATAGAKEADVSTYQLEEVVVTARKTQESLQKVPVSVSAITSEDLEKRSLDNLSAIGQATPNFTFGEQLQGGRSAGVVFIRGVGQADTLATYDPAVGVYIDGVFLGRMQGNDLEMMEIERVEILRGPQGTLFGKNTSGGAVSITTKQPDASAGGFSGKLQTTVGSRDRIDAVAGVNLPLVTDKAALLLSGSRRRQDGFGERADGQDQGSTNRDSGRLSLLLKPWDDFSALFSADATSYDETNAVLKLLAVDTTVNTVAFLNTNTDPDYDERWLAPSDFFNYATGPNSSRGRLWGSALTLNYGTSWGNIKSISAYRHNDVDNNQDPDLSPITFIDEFQTVKQHQVSQELQATGTSFSNRLNWVLGVYYFHERAYSNTSYALLVPVAGYAASFTERFFITNDSYAAYGQGNYSLTDRLKFTAGLRYTHDDKEVQRFNLTYPDGADRQTPATKNAGSNDWSPRVGFDYQWTPTLMTYMSAARGYKGGGFNGRGGTIADFNQFNPEVVWTYELGLRSDLFDRRVRFNATAFYSDYKDLQLQINGSQEINGQIAPFNFVTNIPKSRIVGGELELAVIPATGLKLTSGLGLIYADYVELPADESFEAANLLNRDTEFVNTPKVSLTLAAEYTRRLTDAIDLTSRIDYAHKSEIQYWVTNSAYLRQEPYGLLNARLTFEHAPSQVSLSVFGINLTDEHYIVGGFDDLTVPNPGLGFVIANMGRPREFGASVQVRF
jgi:iron complex outermembrane receptor protein